jgi:hypothetical protein
MADIAGRPRGALGVGLGGESRERILDYQVAGAADRPAILAIPLAKSAAFGLAAALGDFVARRPPMSPPSQPLPPVPEDTARIARAAFRRGNPYVLLRDKLGAVFADADFADLYPEPGRRLARRGGPHLSRSCSSARA